MSCERRNKESGARIGKPNGVLLELYRSVVIKGCFYSPHKISF